MVVVILSKDKSILDKKLYTFQISYRFECKNILFLKLHCFISIW